MICNFVFPVKNYKNKGWLSDKITIANPYFIKEMVFFNAKNVRGRWV